MMLTYYRLREKVEAISEEARKRGEDRLKRMLAEMARRGIAPMPEKTCPSTGFTYITRFFTASIIVDLASELKVNAIAVPVLLDIPKISEKVLAQVKAGKAPPEVSMVVFTELMLPDVDALAAAWSEGGRDHILENLHYYWASLMVSAPLPFDYYMTQSEYEEEVAGRWISNLYFLKKLTFILEEVMDDVMGEGKPSFPDKVFKLAGVKLEPERLNLLKANMLRKLPPKHFLPELLSIIPPLKL